MTAHCDAFALGSAERAGLHALCRDASEAYNSGRCLPTAGSYRVKCAAAPRCCAVGAAGLGQEVDEDAHARRAYGIGGYTRHRFEQGFDLGLRGDSDCRESPEEAYLIGRAFGAACRVGFLATVDNPHPPMRVEFAPPAEGGAS